MAVLLPLPFPALLFFGFSSSSSSAKNFASMDSKLVASFFFAAMMRSRAAFAISAAVFGVFSVEGPAAATSARTFSTRPGLAAASAISDNTVNFRLAFSRLPWSLARGWELNCLFRSSPVVSQLVFKYTENFSSSLHFLQW